MACRSHPRKSCAAAARSLIAPRPRREYDGCDPSHARRGSRIVTRELAWPLLTDDRALRRVYKVPVGRRQVPSPGSSARGRTLTGVGKPEKQAE